MLYTHTLVNLEKSYTMHGPLSKLSLVRQLRPMGSACGDVDACGRGQAFTEYMEELGKGVCLKKWIKSI